MKKTMYSSMGKEKCSSCGNYHYQWWMISHHKKLSKRTGCASVMNYNKTEDYYEIFSHYGSGYDTSNFKVVRTLFPKKKTSSIRKLIELVNCEKEHLICDNCIKRFIARKYITLLSSWYE